MGNQTSSPHSHSGEGPTSRTNKSNNNQYPNNSSKRHQLKKSLTHHGGDTMISSNGFSHPSSPSPEDDFRSYICLSSNIDQEVPPRPDVVVKPKQLSKRHSSALEFVSGTTKSPLKEYLKGKFTKASESASSSSSTTVEAMLNPAVDKFTKLLAQLSISSGVQSGCIAQPVIEKHLVPHSPLMAAYLADFLSKGSGGIPDAAFNATVEKVFALHTDKDQLVFYLKVFSGGKDMMEKTSFMDFLISGYQLATVGETVEHGDASRMTRDDGSFEGREFLDAVVKSCYHIKEEMSICFLSNLLSMNLPRIHSLVHKYIIHQLTTGHSQLTTGNATIHTGGSGVTTVVAPPPPPPLPEETSSEEEGGLSFKTSQINGTDNNALAVDNHFSNKLDPLLMWLLRSSLPSKYLQIFNNQKPEKPLSFPSSMTASTSAQFLMQLMAASSSPSPMDQQREGWGLLYDSESDGLSINRFQFHLFNYRGPSMLLVHADNGYTLAIASGTEWKESCHFWGDEDSMLVQIQPEFRIVEKGIKLIYVNFSIRGYPFGIHAGKDPKTPSLEIKPDFSYAHFKKIPCRILRLTAWGCAPKQAKVAQSDHKKWEARQCENLRKVNIHAADWKDNPDKYLLELAGNYRSYDS